MAQTVYTPANASEFSTAAAVVNPGDVIELPAGVVSGWNALVLTRDGTAEAPIIVRAPSVYGTTITGSTFFVVQADHVVIKGFKFINTTSTYPVWFFSGSHGRVTQCYFDDANASTYVRADPATGVLDSASNLVIDHNYFTEGSTNAINLVGLADSGFVGGHLIEHNIFRDAPQSSGTNEAISLYSDGKHMGYRLNATVAHNVFDNWDGDPDLEIVTIKSGGNTFKGNVFAWCNGYFSFRRENENRLEGNLFYRNTEGTRVYGDGHVIINNVFESLDRWGLYMGNSWDQGGGIEAKAATNCLIAHNTFSNTPYRTWVFYESSMPDGGTVPIGNLLAGNIVESLVNTDDLVRDQSGFFAVNTIDRNLFHRIGGNLGPTGTNPVTSGPAQLTGSGDQLYLTAGSPALNAGSAGTGVTTDFFGSPRDGSPDLGHHEFGAAATPIAEPPLPPLPPDRTGYDALPLEAAFTTYPATVVAGEAMNLDAATSKGSIVEYSWDFGDGNSYTGAELFFPHDWAVPGLYTITLTVKDGSNATDSRQLQVIVTNPDNPYDPFIDADGDWVHAANDPDDADPRNPFPMPLQAEIIRSGSDWILRVPLSPGVTTTAQQSDDLAGWGGFYTFPDVAAPQMGETTIPPSLTPPAKDFSSWRASKSHP
ncbi:MAG: chondroitinase-B domain-containing protein [Oceanipulchritudo sp.]